MAAVAVGSVKEAKRRTQKRRRSQRKRRLQHGSRRRSRSRKSVAEKRKTSEQGKRGPMRRRRRSASKGSFCFDAKKLKEAKGSGRFLSREAKELLLTFVEDIYKRVSSVAEQMRRESHEATVSPMHVQAALQSVMPKRRWKQVAFRNRRQKNAPPPQGRGLEASQLLWA